ncbi:MAG: DUF4382 domain-containing protein [Rikenellaceae bacterium]
MKKIILLSGILICLSSFLVSCNTNDDSTAQVYVNLVIADAPTFDEFEQVNLSFSGVKLVSYLGHYSSETLQGTVAYNFLDLMNGQDSILVRLPVTYGDSISEIQLISGSINELVTADGDVIAMDASVAQNYGVTFAVNNYSSSYPDQDYDVMIDINLQKSIQMEDSTYYFRPVIRSYVRQGTSYIEGWAQPDSLSFVVYTVTEQNDTITTISDPSLDNYFRLSGLPSSSYTVYFEPQYSSGSYSESVTVDDANVSMGEVLTGLTSSDL